MTQSIPASGPDVQSTLPKGFRHTAKAALASALFALTGTVAASPFTLYFEGDVQSVYNYNTNITMYPGSETFFGYMTWDLENAVDPSDYGPDSTGLEFAKAQSISGCLHVLNGSNCISDYGTNAPMILDYRVTWSGGTHSIVASANAYEDSFRQNYRLGPPGDTKYDVFEANKYQEQITDTDVTSGMYDYVQTGFQQALRLGIHLDVNNVLFGDVRNLNVAPDVSLLTPGYTYGVSFHRFAYSANCFESSECLSFAIDPNSFQVEGTLTSAYLVAGMASVPEPGTLALLGLGLIGLAYRRTKTKGK